MTSNYYCQHCDKHIDWEYEQRHIKSQSHSYMYYNIVTNKYNFGNVYWVDFKTTIEEYIKENNTKFLSFTIVVRCKLNDEDTCISIDNKPPGDASLYEFHDGERIYYKCYTSEQIRDYIFHRAILMGNKLISSSIISNLTITLFSKYKLMTPGHQLQQPRRVLESKLLKHIKNASYDDKINKYHFLTNEYELLF